MKAISIWQPWASLIAYGLKRVETRDWPTRPILIHASKRWTRDEREAAEDLWPAGEPGYADEHGDRVLPFGAVVAVARLVSCVRMTPDLIALQHEDEIARGAWLPGRWAWVLADVQRLDPPIHLRGRQGLFEVRLSQEMTADDARRVASLAPLEGLRG